MSARALISSPKVAAVGDTTPSARRCRGFAPRFWETRLNLIRRSGRALGLVSFAAVAAGCCGLPFGGRGTHGHGGHHYSPSAAEPGYGSHQAPPRQGRWSTLLRCQPQPPDPNLKPDFLRLLEHDLGVRRRSEAFCGAIRRAAATAVVSSLDGGLRRISAGCSGLHCLVLERQSRLPPPPSRPSAPAPQPSP